MIKGYHSNVMKIYDTIRDEEQTALEKRKAEVEKSRPEIFDLERKIGRLCVELSISSIKTMENRDEYLQKLRNQITNLRVKKAEMLVESGFTSDYLNLGYRCIKCKDTGFIGAEKCNCYKQKLVQLYYKNSELNNILKEHNFDHFNLEYYSSRRTGDEPQSPRKNMEEILSKSMNFLKGYPTSKENLLFYGNSGTGKTFLSHCIAKELLDRGYFVVYRTSEELIQNLRTIRFDNDSTLEELIVDCDLLIIDDLGTEQINDFSKTELFNILNKKLLRQKNLLVSTNYSLKELLTIYSERITSRLLGNFNLCKFYGEDIRVTKNLNSIK
jgi:DNA replication protein